MSKKAATLFMLLGTIFWGAGFVAQDIASQYMGSFTLTATRYMVSVLVLIPVMLLIHKKSPVLNDAPEREYIKAGVICGLTQFSASMLQQIGIENSTAGNSGFVTSIYVVLVPIFGWLFLKRRMEVKTIIAALAATVGLYLLCVSEGFYIKPGDWFSAAGAVFWALQIFVIERYGAHLDGIKFTLHELATTTVLSTICMLLFEQPTIEGIRLGILPILYCGIFSLAFGCTAQIVVVKYTDTVLATLIMSCEGAFSALFGWLLLGDTLSARQLAGCALVFAAVLVAQLPIFEGGAKKAAAPAKEKLS